MHLLAILAIVVAAVATGVVVGTSAPTSKASSSADAEGECTTETNAFTACVLQTNLDGNETACVSCLAAYVPDNVTTCSESEFYACGAMPACTACGNCEFEYVAIGNCKNRGVCPSYECVSGPFSHGQNEVQRILTTLLVVAAAIFFFTVMGSA
jgi:hypothetical protein